MSHRDDDLPARIGIALFGSLLLHAAVFVALGSVIDFEPPEPPPARPLPARPIPIMSEDEVERLIALAQKHPPPKVVPPVKPEEEKPPEPKKPELEKPQGQVVEIPPPPREEVPDDARLLSDYNSKVEKEMVSAAVRQPSPRMLKSDRRLLSPGDDEKGASAAPNRRRAEKTSPRVSDTPGDAENRGATPGPAAQPGETQPKKADPRNDPLVQGDGPFKPSVETANAPEAKPGGGGTPGGSPEPPRDWMSLLPTLGPEDVAREEGSIDHIEDMDKGDQTFLNTREYQYAWFFNRVKGQVQRRWQAVEAHRRHDPYGRVYGVRDRQTVVEVTLDPAGTLEEIIVTSGSGVAFLDEAAVAAFQDASPFPNPPEGLKDPDGRIRFRFAFFLEISGRGMRFLPRRPPP
jgi:TonB family protein